MSLAGGSDERECTQTREAIARAAGVRQRGRESAAAVARPATKGEG